MVSHLKLGLLLLISSLMGCETMMAHYSISDKVADGYGRATAMAVGCADSGFIPKLDAYALGYYTTQLLDISVYNHAAYEQGHRDTLNKLEGLSGYQLESGCSSVMKAFPQVTNTMKKRYEDTAEYLSVARAQEFNQMLATLAEPTTTPVYTAPTITPDNKVDFGQGDGAGYNHYLINTSSGLTQCHVSSSGYTFCN